MADRGPRPGTHLPAPLTACAVPAEQAAEGRVRLEAVLRLLSLDQREFIATSYLGLLASAAE